MYQDIKMYQDKQWIDVRLDRVHRAGLGLCEHVVTGRVVIHYYPVGDVPLPKPSRFQEVHESMAKAEAHLAEVFPTNAGYQLLTVIGKTV